MTNTEVMVRRDGQWPENNALSFLEINGERFPDKTALKWVQNTIAGAWDGTSSLIHESLSYRDLVRKSACIARGLKNVGLVSGNRVIMYLPMSPELYLTMFAVLRIGAVAVFLDTWATKEQIGFCVSRTRPSAMISTEKAFTLVAAVPELRAIPVKITAGGYSAEFACDLASLLVEKEEEIMEPVCPETPALITFTTGSSGLPKGAVRTHGFLAAQHRSLNRCIPYHKEDIDLTTFPIFSLNSLASGITVVLPAINLTAPSQNDPRLLAEQISSARVTCCMLSPQLFSDVAEYCGKNRMELSTLRRAATGGAPVGKETIRKFRTIAPQASVLVLYGSTEAEPIASIEAEEMLKDTGEEIGVNVGRIVDDLEFKFIKIHRGPVELGAKGWNEWESATAEAGELVVSGSHVCHEYYQDPASFCANKIQDTNGKVWHRTGDVGVLDPRGRLWIIGRVHNAILRSGWYLYPVRAEMLLKTLTFVRQAAYVGIADASSGERACAVISLHRESHPEDSATYELIARSALEGKGIPVDEVRIIEEIPMDPRHRSKVEYSILREMVK
jgi:acyl-CoA synthetase (AMP-forming)/AMP-acid ligase II